MEGGKAVLSGAGLDFKLKQENPLYLIGRPHSPEKNAVAISDVYPERTSKGFVFMLFFKVMSTKAYTVQLDLEDGFRQFKSMAEKHERFP